MTKCGCGLVVLGALLLATCSPVQAYGPLNHLCVVDQNWKAIWTVVQRVGSPISEKEARELTFAGALAEDLGYYLTADKTLVLLTDSMHYVGTGDWVKMQLQDAIAQHDAGLFSFALGELWHYAAERMGHFYGTNVVAVEIADSGDL